MSGARLEIGGDGGKGSGLPLDVSLGAGVCTACVVGFDAAGAGVAGVVDLGLEVGGLCFCPVLEGLSLSNLAILTSKPCISLVTSSLSSQELVIWFMEGLTATRPGKL